MAGVAVVGFDEGGNTAGVVVVGFDEGGSGASCLFGHVNESSCRTLGVRRGSMSACGSRVRWVSRGGSRRRSGGGRGLGARDERPSRGCGLVEETACNGVGGRRAASHGWTVPAGGDAVRRPSAGEWGRRSRPHCRSLGAGPHPRPLARGSRQSATRRARDRRDRRARDRRARDRRDRRARDRRDRRVRDRRARAVAWPEGQARPTARRQRSMVARASARARTAERARTASTSDGLASRCSRRARASAKWASIFSASSTFAWP